jgi:hypothetical protein
MGLPSGTETLRVLSLRPLWAAMRLGKNIENRAQRWGYRGPVVIHAAKHCTPVQWFADMAEIQRIIGRYLTQAELDEAMSLRGKLIAITEIVECVTAIHSPWFVGPYGYHLRDTAPLTPTGYTGGQGLQQFRPSAVGITRLADINDWFNQHGYMASLSTDQGGQLRIHWAREARAA